MTNILTNNLALVEENNLTQSYDQNNSAPGPTVPGTLTQTIILEQPEIFTELDAACPPFCNNTNMTNEEFFTGLAKKELWEPGPWEIPFLLESYMKQQSETKKDPIISTVQGPPHVVYKIRGRLRYPPRGKKSMGKIDRWTFTDIPYTGIYDENIIKYYYINGKVVRADSLSLYERMKRARKPCCLWT